MTDVTDATAVDVAIVGAGIAGSALACALSGAGLRIALLEAAPRPTDHLPTGSAVADFDTRVSALTPRSVQWLDGICAWEAIRDYRTCAYRHMTVWDAEGTGEIEFDCSEVRAPALGHLVENRAVIRSLLQRVDAAEDIHFLNPVRLEGCTRQADGGMLLEMDAGSPDAGSPDAGSSGGGSADGSPSA